MKPYRFASKASNNSVNWTFSRCCGRLRLTFSAMAYLRYSGNCEWYIFERSDLRLAVWHKDFREIDASFDRSEVASILENNSFEAVHGYRLDQAEILRGAFEAWLQDRAE